MFEWIDSKFTILSQNPDQKTLLGQLKNAVASQMKDFIEQNVDKTVQMIEKWFDDSYSNQLIVGELSEFPEIQFKLLQQYLHFNEFTIRLTINEANTQEDKKQQAEKYIQYLCLFVTLLCQMNRIKPEEVSEDLIEAYVKKDYYPIQECLQICTQFGQDKAIAILQEKEDKLLEAIDTNMQYLKKVSLISLGQELSDIVMVCSHRQKSKTKYSVDEVIRAYSDRWEFEECYKYKHLKNFDSTV